MLVEFHRNGRNHNLIWGRPICEYDPYLRMTECDIWSANMTLGLQMQTWTLWDNNKYKGNDINMNNVYATIVYTFYPSQSWHFLHINMFWQHSRFISNRGDSNLLAIHIKQTRNCQQSWLEKILWTKQIVYCVPEVLSSQTTRGLCI